jgi:hypothetical protein
MKIQRRKPFRQGDVLFVPVKNIPKGERKIRKDGVVMYGESTGHAHRVMDLDAAEVYDIDGQGCYIAVSHAGGVWIGHEDHGQGFIHPETGERIPLPAGYYRVLRQVEYSPEAIREVTD